MSEDGNIFGTISGVNWWLQTTRLVVVCEEQERQGGQGGAEALDAPGQHLHWLLACCYLVLPDQANLNRYFNIRSI